MQMAAARKGDKSEDVRYQKELQARSMCLSAGIRSQPNDLLKIGDMREAQQGTLCNLKANKQCSIQSDLGSNLGTVVLKCAMLSLKWLATAHLLERSS
jgi:hypothetical protein